MILQVPIPPKLRERLEHFAAEAAGLSRDDLIIPDNATCIECREVVWQAIDHTKARPHGHLYIDLAKGLFYQATMPKGLRPRSST